MNNEFPPAGPEPEGPSTHPTPPKPSAKAAARAFFLGGVLPVVAFALVEEIYGTIGGLIAGIVFGFGEVAWEWWKFRKVQAITIIGNLLVIVLGVVSLFEGNSLWFKLQPAAILLVFSGLLIVSSWIGRPFLVEMARKQNPGTPPEAIARLKGLNTRIGFVFLAMTALSVHAAYAWTTAAWAFLKGIGVPLIIFVWLGGEILVIRWRASRRQR